MNRLVEEKLKESIEYMDTVRRDRKYKNVRDDCLNHVPDCTLWAAQVSICNCVVHIMFILSGNELTVDLSTS